MELASQKRLLYALADINKIITEQGLYQLEACFLVVDDIMDNSETRRKEPCWYKLDCRGVNASHDALLLEQCAYVLLRKNFRGKAFYAQLVRLFHKVCLQSYYGQAMDTQQGNMKDDPEMKGYAWPGVSVHKLHVLSKFLPLESTTHVPIVAGILAKQIAALLNTKEF